jgi:hypothetical protein
MPAALKLAAERPHVLAIRIKHENGRMIGPFPVALVNHVEIAGSIDRHIMGRLPGELVGQLRPIVQYFIAVGTTAENDRRIGLLGGEHARCHGHGRGSRRKLKELPSSKS